MAPIPSRVRPALAVALALAGAFLGLAAVEAAMRLAGVGRVFAEADPVLGYRLTPSFTRTVTLFEAPGGELRLATNDRGLRRDQPTTVAKAPGTKRVLVVGDSQTEGIVDNADTFSARLEELLGAEVLNAGVSGYSPLLELLALDERSGLQPDVIVLVLYTGNDVGELTARRADFGGFGPSFAIPILVRTDGAWIVEPPAAAEGWLGRADVWLQSRLRLYAALRRRLQPPTTAHTPAELAAAVAECFGCAQALWQPWLAERQPEAFAAAEAAFDEIARRLAERSRRGARLVVAVLPSKIEVEPETVAREVESAATTLGLRRPPAEMNAAVRARMLAALARHGLDPLDLTPALRAAFESAGEPLYWNADWHLNPRGHRAVAEALRARLQEALRSDPG